jgi:muconolactone delta-isomerase
MSGAVGLVLLVHAESAPELDEIITSLPVWPRMETEVTPLTTFEDRAQTVRSRLEQLKETTKDAA